MKHLLVTGAAGFIGSTFVRQALERNYRVTILDKLTYAGHLENIQDVLKVGVCEFVKGDIGDFNLADNLIQKNEFSGVINFAAESHVDNSIKGPRSFIETNILGTFHLLEAIRKNSHKWKKAEKSQFRFLHVSTDEVYGSVSEGRFNEDTPYAPNSPYSASKAASDMLIRAWYHTFNIPTITTNCSNNYGPRQYPEKLIPLVTRNAIQGKSLPIYGSGQNVRDWIHVEDHCRGIMLAFEKGLVGQTYCFGGDAERSNVDVVKSVCRILDELHPRGDGQKHEIAIQYVDDRPGHDFRYAIDDRKALRDLGFERRTSNFESGLRETVQWYLKNPDWIEQVTGRSKPL